MFFKPLLVVAVVVCLAFGPVKAQSNSLANVLQSNSQTNLFFNLTNSTNPSLISFLQGGNNTNATYTVFAPANSAFTPQVIALLSSYNNLRSLLLYHIVNGSHPSSSFQSGPNIIDSLANDSAVLKWSNATGLPLNVVKGGANSASGSSSTPSSTTNITVSYGVGSVNVIQADVTASNGIIYIIDNILSLPQSPSHTEEQKVTSGEQIDLFGQELNQTNLASTVDNTNGVTIFAPSDSSLSSTNLSGLSSDTLTKILKYHVVNQVYYTTNLTNLTANGPINITTAEGSNLTVTVSGSDITVGNDNTTGKIVETNILTDNGVIHIIDKVLFPTDLYSNSNNSSNSSSSSSAAPALHGPKLALLISGIAIIASLHI